MLATALTVVLQALDLAQSAFKPTPNLNGGQAVVETGPDDTVIYNPQYESFAANTRLGHELAVNCYVKPYDPPAIRGQQFPAFDERKSTIYRFRQQQSVNLGSWFVQEDWMVPSLLTCAGGNKVSELDVASGWGSVKSARALLERHWDQWITEADFKYLADIGINTVRLPIGYWSLGPEHTKDTPFAPYAEVYKNSWARVVRAINMANQWNIGVLVDLHGAPGSQNGQGHSGISDGATNLFDSEANIQKTISVLTFLAERLAVVNNVVGIQILNEPKYVPTLTDFYARAIDSIRKVSPAAATMPLYLHDGFDLDRFSQFVANRTDFVIQDHHSYFVFTPKDEKKPASQHTSDVDTTVSASLSKVSADQRRNLIVGEWSCALTPQSLVGETDQNEARRSFCTDQLEAYTNTTAGWSFWSYKKEDCANDPGWCFTAAIGTSLPKTFFSYGQPETSLRTQAISALSEDPSISNILSNQGPSVLTGTSSLLGPRNLAMSVRHRPSEIHARRNQLASPRVLWNRDDPAQSVRAQGYADGFSTAKLFALNDLSKLGFTGQYILDSRKKLGPGTVPVGSEVEYERSFMKGLKDGEAVVATMVQNTI